MWINSSRSFVSKTSRADSQTEPIVFSMGAVWEVASAARPQAKFIVSQ